MNNVNTINQNSYSKFNSYEEYMKQATDPQFISEMIATYGSYENYQKALKVKRSRTNRIWWKFRINWFFTRTLPKLAITAVIIAALGYVFFFM